MISVIWVLCATLMFNSYSFVGGDLLYDDRNGDDEFFHRYSYDGGFHYNDYAYHEYSHLFEYNYYYYSNPLNFDVTYVGSIHTTEYQVATLSLSGSTVMAGGYSQTLSVYNFQNNHASFQYTMTMPPSAFDDDAFPYPPAAVDGNRSVIHAYRNTIFIYGLYNGSWSHQSSLYHNMARFDIAEVAISGNVFVASAYPTGNVSVYEFLDNNWTVSSIIYGTRYFGSAVALSGDNLLIGSPYEDCVYYYKRNASGWIVQGIIEGPDYQGLFGDTVAMSGNISVIGTSGPHVAYIYRLKEGVWVFQNTIDNGALAIAVYENTCMIVDLLRAQSIRVYDLGIAGAEEDDDDSDSLEGSKKDNTTTLVIAVSAGGGVSLILVAVCILLWCRFKRVDKHSKLIVPGVSEVQEKIEVIKV